MNPIERDWEPFQDEYGLVHPSRQEITEPSQNGIRFTTEMLAALNRHGKLTEGLKTKYVRVLEQCEANNGLLIRHPSNPFEQEGPDDYVAWGFAAKLLGAPLMAMRVIQYGCANWWNYNNTLTPGFSSSAFMGRQPQLIAHLIMAGGGEPPAMLKAYWASAIYVSKFSKSTNQDAWVLSWMLVKTADGQGGIIEGARRSWIRAFKKKVPGGIGALLGKYYGDPEHPSAVHLWDEYGE